MVGGMGGQQLPDSGAGREVRATLSPGETVLAYAVGKGGSLLVATDRRALVVKVGAAATGKWFGKKVASLGYRQLSGVQVHTGFADGYVELVAAGMPTQGGRLGRYAQLVHADNVCPFAKRGEADFRRVVEVINQHLLAHP